MPTWRCTAPRQRPRRRCFYDRRMDEAVRARRELATDLRHAIDARRIRDALSGADVGHDRGDHGLRGAAALDIIPSAA